MPHDENPLEDIGEKGENADYQNFLLIPQSFLTYKGRFNVLSNIYLSSANAFNLDKTRDFLSSKGLRNGSMEVFWIH